MANFDWADWACVTGIVIAAALAFVVIRGSLPDDRKCGYYE